MLVQPITYKITPFGLNSNGIQKAAVNFKGYNDESKIKQDTLQFCSQQVQSRSHEAKIKVPAGLHSFLETLAEDPRPGLFQLLEVTHRLQFVPPFLHLQSQQHKVRHHASFSDTSLLLPRPLLSTLVITPGLPGQPRKPFPSSSQLVANLISSAILIPLLPCKLTIHWFQALGYS